MSIQRVTILALIAFLSLHLLTAHAQSTSSETKAPSTGKPKESVPTLGYNVLLETKEERLNVGIFGQFTSFKRGDESFSGNSFEVTAGYALSEKFAYNLNLMQALDLADGASVLYSGIRTSVSYALKGDIYSRRSTVMVNGAPSVSITPFQEPNLLFDFGVDQIFFNGTTRVAPATGFSAGAQYARTVYNYRLALMARYGALKVSNDPVDLLTAGIGLLYRF